ncbi:SMP-30/gluconolactonase/LRE family protein [Methylomonas sp. AM2-LC]|uniref:SMP-30/gluconolactonase/LRE family protein n=1 Tax=Methylomonas sp. AM2-LC TaxID=3153301 RepID=UPI003263C43A
MSFIKPIQRSVLSLAIVIALTGSVKAEDSVVTSIPGVADAGTKVELIKEGFNGTEGPISLPDGSAIFTETTANRITRVGIDNTISTFLENTNGANGLAFTPSGELIAVQTLNTKVGIIYPAGKEKVLAENFAGTAFQRPNDLVLAKNGGIYFTDSGTRASKENPNPPRSNPGVYYISPIGDLKRLATPADIERPNGIQLSPNEKTLYVANTAGEYLLAYDIASDGSISGKRNFAKLQGWSQTDNVWSSGADGLAIDAEGRVFAVSNLGIEVFTDKGEALGIIPVPKKPQNIAFVGKDKKTLFIVGRGSAYKIALKTAGYSGRVK